ncbi:MAG: hypothetical protein RIG68_18070 [Imperialibacter sp.]|uniref:alpha/beta hydrolase family protein n=1 Tax=Imperialibacter sp. TaxID=2038411 RepID=UPI0032F07BC3
MKSIDMIFLTVLILTASCLIITPNRVKGILKPLIASIIILAIVQLLIESYYWQYIPTYLLIVAMTIVAIFPQKHYNKTKERLIGFTLLFLALASAVPWAIFTPIPKLTKPQGNYAVGTKIFRWVDFDRAEDITSDPNDRRNVVVQAWYPTEGDEKGIHSSYVDGLNNLPEKIGVLPKIIFDHYDQVDTHGILNATISRDKNQWPVIIFLTGNSAARAFYTSVVAGLASYGYVVLAIDHPYEAMITQLANGEIATPIEVFLKYADGPTNFMKDRIDLRMADVQFVLNQLSGSDTSANSFLSSLDRNQIVITGHSLGGATAAVAMALDSRIKAAANVDGTLYGELPTPNEQRPFLLLESKKDPPDQYVRYEDGNQRLFEHFEGGYRYQIIDADHYSFTDAPLLLAPPTRLLAGSVFGFGNIPTMTHNATVDILNSFFYSVLNNEMCDLDSVASRYKGIIRKPVD